MAAKKSSSKKSSSTKSSSKSSKKDATKTPSSASKQAKVEHRRPAPTVGDTAGAEFNPARTEEGDRVAQTGANPAASRAGMIVQIDTPAPPQGDDDPKGEVGLGGISFAVVDGARARLKIGSTETGLLTQADLQTLGKTLDSVIQQTY